MATHRPITSVPWEAKTGVFLKFLSCQLSSRFSETLSQGIRWIITQQPNTLLYHLYICTGTQTHAHTHEHTTDTPCEHTHKYSPDERKDGEATQYIILTIKHFGKVKTVKTVKRHAIIRER